jgi:hypothetical protein
MRPSIKKLLREYMEIENGGEIHFSIEGSIHDKSVVKKYVQRLFPSIVINKIKKVLIKRGSQGATFSRPNTGIYKDNDNQYHSDTSVAVYLAGVSSAELRAIAEQIKHELNHDSVLVRDFNASNTYFI